MPAQEGQKLKPNIPTKQHMERRGISFEEL